MSQTDEWKEMKKQVKEYDKDARETFWKDAGKEMGVKKLKLFMQRKIDRPFFRTNQSGAKKKYYPESYLKKQGFPVTRIVRVATASGDFKDTPSMGRCYPCEILDEDQRHGQTETYGASMIVGDRGEDDAGQEGNRGTRCTTASGVDDEMGGTRPKDKSSKS